MTRSENGLWRVGQNTIDGLEKCVDLDFGFTPATNFLQLRRCNLSVGETADIPVAWLDVPEASLILLPQRYEKRSESTYWYESPQSSYSALLEMTPSGFVRLYPDLWVMEK